MIRAILDYLFASRYRTPAELPADQWRGYLCAFHISHSTRKAWSPR
jgi:hypothetical protein